jgi:hypothetical protein
MQGENSHSLILGFEWPNSSNSFPTDKAKWDKLATATSFDEKVKVITSTDWYKAYKGQVKGHVRACCKQCGDQHTVKLVCIEGGLVSQVELQTMEGVKEEIVKDLKDMKIKNAETMMSVQCYATFQDMHDELASCALAASPGQAEEQQRLEAERRSKAEEYALAYRKKAKEARHTLRAVQQAVGVAPSGTSSLSSLVEPESVQRRDTAAKKASQAMAATI